MKIILSIAVFGLALVTTSFAADPGPTPEPKFRLAPSADLDQPGGKKASMEAQQLSRKAISEMTKGDLVGATRDFQKVLEMVPDNAATMINLGLAQYQLKKYAEAERQLQTAVRLAPDSGLGWLILGVVEYDQNKLDRALASLATAAVLEPKNATVHHYLGVTIGQKGWYSGAEEEMRKALEIDPNYADAHYNLAVFYLQRTPPAIELARRHYQQALDLGAAPDPDIAKRLDAVKP